MTTIRASFPTLRVDGMSITQGRYGLQGNLELVAPHVDDGFWVFWFNGDDAQGWTPAPGAVPGAWSGGLHIPTGRRLTRTVVHQQPDPPFHVDVFGRCGEQWWRWYWTPERGFLDGGAIASDQVPVPAGTRLPPVPGETPLLARCSSTLAGGTDEQIVRTADGVQHRRHQASTGTLRSQAMLESVVLTSADPDTGTRAGVHREGIRPVRP